MDHENFCESLTAGVCVGGNVHVLAIGEKWGCWKIKSFPDNVCLFACSAHCVFCVVFIVY